MYPNPGYYRGQVLAQYIRYPNDPKWTFVTLTGGEPVFDSTQADYQDFELPSSDVPTLTNKILQMAGMNIREQAVTQYGMQEEAIEDQKEV